MSDSVRPHRWQPTRLLCPWDSPGKNAGVGCHFFLQCMKVKSESEICFSQSVSQFSGTVMSNSLRPHELQHIRPPRPSPTAGVYPNPCSLSRWCHPAISSSAAPFYWRRQWHPTPVLLPGKSHGWRSLVGCSPRGREESDTTEWLQFDFSLSCIGERNGNPLHCSCLENPRDRGTWWAAVYGVAQSWTRLKRLSSSSGKVYKI